MSSDEPLYAGFFRRAAAVLLDIVILSVVISFFHIIIFGHSGLQYVSVDGVLSIQASGYSWFDDVAYLVISIIMWVHFFGTPGKLLMECYVADARTGKAIGYWKGLLRYIGYFVSLLPLGLGFLWVLWDKKKQGFHDKIAKTVVLRKIPMERDDESRKSLQQILAEVK